MSDNNTDPSPWTEKDKNIDLREDIAELSDFSGTKIFVFDQPPYDSAVVGFCDRPEGKVSLVYDYDKMLESLVKNENMSVEDAADFLSSDTLSQAANAGITILQHFTF